MVRPDLERLLEQGKRQEQARTANAALSVLNERNEVLKRSLSSQVPDVWLDKVFTLLQQQVEDLRAQATMPNPLPLTPSGLERLEELLSTDLEQAVSQVHSIRKEETALLERKKIIEWRLSQEADAQHLKKYAERIRKLSEQKGALEQKVKQLEQQISSLELAKKQVSRRMESIARELTLSEDADRIVRYAIRSQEMLRDYRHRLAVIKSANLTAAIMDSFSKLTHKQILVKSIKLDPESLNLSLVDYSGNELPKTSLSSGERQMLAVSILWGLARTSGRDLPVVIDTPMGRLDSSHRLNFVSSYLPMAAKQVLILSTDTEIVGRYLEVLQPHISHTYLLSYDETNGKTDISRGYFENEEVTA